MVAVALREWQKVWRQGIAPVLPTAHLRALADGLRRGDSRLIQGQMTTPPPMQCVLDWPVEAASSLVYGGWQAGDFETVGDAEEFFAKVCFEADQRIGEPAAVRYFLNHEDETPREVFHAELVAEVRLALDQR